MRYFYPLLAVVMLMSASYSHAATLSWTGKNGSDWYYAKYDQMGNLIETNWSNNKLPQPTDDLVIPTGTVVSDVFAKANSLTLGDGVTFSGGLTATSMTISANSKVTVSAQINVTDFVNNGTLNLAGSHITCTNSFANTPGSKLIVKQCSVTAPLIVNEGSVTGLCIASADGSSNCLPNPVYIVGNDNALIGNVTNKGAAAVFQGFWLIKGDLTNNDGLVTPQNSNSLSGFGLIQVQGTYIQNHLGKTEFKIGALSTTDQYYDQMIIAARSDGTGGTFTPDGKLSIVGGGQFVLPAFKRLDLISAAGNASTQNVGILGKFDVSNVLTDVIPFVTRYESYAVSIVVLAGSYPELQSVTPATISQKDGDVAHVTLTGKYWNNTATPYVTKGGIQVTFPQLKFSPPVIDPLTSLWTLQCDVDFNALPYLDNGAYNFQVRHFYVPGSIDTAITSVQVAPKPHFFGNQQLDPAFAMASGNTQVTIPGSGFAPGARVIFDGIPASNVNVLSSASITCLCPPHKATQVRVVVENPDGQRTNEFENFTYNGTGSTPVVTSFTPPIGLPDGGTAVSVTGSGFDQGAVVSFAGIPATQINVVSATLITCLSPAHAEGNALVEVVNPGGFFGPANSSYIYGFPPPPPPTTGLSTTTPITTVTLGDTVRIEMTFADQFTPQASCTALPSGVVFPHDANGKHGFTIGGIAAEVGTFKFTVTSKDVTTGQVSTLDLQLIINPPENVLIPATPTFMYSEKYTEVFRAAGYYGLVQSNKLKVSATLAISNFDPATLSESDTLQIQLGAFRLPHSPFKLKTSAKNSQLMFTDLGTLDNGNTKKLLTGKITLTATSLVLSLSGGYDELSGLTYDKFIVGSNYRTQTAASISGKIPFVLTLGKLHIYIPAIPFAGSAAAKTVHIKFPKGLTLPNGTHEADYIQSTVNTATPGR